MNASSLFVRVRSSFLKSGCTVAKRDYEKRTEELLKPILEENHLTLWDVEWVKEAGDFHLRAYIDKEGGVTIDDCETVSRALEKQLDAQDFIKENYILEVSSPGLDRPLKKDRDFARSIGKDVEIRFYRQIDGVKELTGSLSSYSADTVTVRLEDGSEKVLNRSDIARIRLAFYF